MAKATTLSFKKDPMNDRRAMVGDMKGFKGSQFPANSFKDGKPKTATDEFYTPFPGKEKK